LWEFYQIYILGAVGDKDERVRFSVKGQGHKEIKYGQKSLVLKGAFPAKGNWSTVCR